MEKKAAAERLFQRWFWPMGIPGGLVEERGGHQWRATHKTERSRALYDDEKKTGPAYGGGDYLATKIADRGPWTTNLISFRTVPVGPARHGPPNCPRPGRPGLPGELKLCKSGFRLQAFSPACGTRRVPSCPFDKFPKFQHGTISRGGIDNSADHLNTATGGTGRRDRPPLGWGQRSFFDLGPMNQIKVLWVKDSGNIQATVRGQLA